jgi:hypothetical protein
VIRSLPNRAPAFDCLKKANGPGTQTLAGGYFLAGEDFCCCIHCSWELIMVGMAAVAFCVVVRLDFGRILSRWKE